MEQPGRLLRKGRVQARRRSSRSSLCRRSSCASRRRRRRRMRRRCRSSSCACIASPLQQARDKPSHQRHVGSIARVPSREFQLHDAAGFATLSASATGGLVFQPPRGTDADVAGPVVNDLCNMEQPCSPASVTVTSARPQQFPETADPWTLRESRLRVDEG